MKIFIISKSLDSVRVDRVGMNNTDKYCSMLIIKSLVGQQGEALPDRHSLITTCRLPSNIIFWQNSRRIVSNQRTKVRTNSFIFPQKWSLPADCHE
jgi:hypothetical protein